MSQQVPLSQQPAPPAPKKKRKGLIIALPVAVVIVAVIAFVAFGLQSGATSPSGGDDMGRVPSEVQDAMRDAASMADELSAEYQALLDDSGGLSSAVSSSSSSSSSSGDSLDDRLDRVEDDLAIVEGSESFEGKEKAIAAITNMKEALEYQEQENQSIQPLEEYESDSHDAGDLFSALEEAYEIYSEINAPHYLAGYHNNSLHDLYLCYEVLAYYGTDIDSTLSQYQCYELLQWLVAKEPATSSLMSTTFAKQFDASSKSLDEVLSGEVSGDKITVEAEAIDEVSPNLYQSLDSAANLYITSPDGSRSITVKATINGFSQELSQKYDLTQGVNYIAVKPAPLPTSEMPDLTNGSTTQFDLVVIDDESGDSIIENSYELALNSFYDFNWANSQFGSTAAIDILAWLRPQADEVNEVNVYAGKILSKWGTEYSMLDGYQHGKDAIGTLVQAAAIQTAISQGAKVEYRTDTYSFKAHQNIKTPDAVVREKSGLCIETSLLMASCLLNAGMHPMLIMTPGHAQVAVETYEGSGNYFLLETTVGDTWTINPKYGIDNYRFYSGLLSLDSSGSPVTLKGDSDEWSKYFASKADDSDEFGGIFVVDCYLQKTLGIQGLENL